MRNSLRETYIDSMNSQVRFIFDESKGKLSLYFQTTTIHFIRRPGSRFLPLRTPQTLPVTQPVRKKYTSLYSPNKRENNDYPQPTRELDNRNAATVFSRNNHTFLTASKKKKKNNNSSACEYILDDSLTLSRQLESRQLACRVRRDFAAASGRRCKRSQVKVRIYSASENSRLILCARRDSRTLISRLRPFPRSRTP